MMNRIICLVPIAALSLMLPVQVGQTEEEFDRWNVRFDMGGVIPEEADLTETGGPVTGRTLKLDAGFQLDLAAGYRITPWLEVGPELGFTFNFIDSIGGWSYPDSSLSQILMMANVRLEYPYQGRLAPFIGAGIGGVASFLTFGGGGYYYYDYYGYYEPAGTAADFSLGFQAFGGLRYRVSDKMNIGLVYRYLATDDQHWDVEWWNGADFGIGVDSIRMHSICLVFSGDF